MTRAIVAPKEEVMIRAVVDEIVRAVGFTGKVLWDFFFLLRRKKFTGLSGQFQVRKVVALDACPCVFRSLQDGLQGRVRGP